MDRCISNGIQSRNLVTCMNQLFTSNLGSLVSMLDTKESIFQSLCSCLLEALGVTTLHLVHLKKCNLPVHAHAYLRYFSFLHISIRPRHSAVL